MHIFSSRPGGAIERPCLKNSGGNIKILVFWSIFLSGSSEFCPLQSLPPLFVCQWLSTLLSFLWLSMQSAWSPTMFVRLSYPHIAWITYQELVSIFIYVQGFVLPKRLLFAGLTVCRRSVPADNCHFDRHSISRPWFLFNITNQRFPFSLLPPPYQPPSPNHPPTEKQCLPWGGTSCRGKFKPFPGPIFYSKVSKLIPPTGR